MSCSSCKKKNDEKYNHIKNEIKEYNKVAVISAIIFFGLSLYGLYSLIIKLL